VRPVKRSFTIAGHSTSISLEARFWDALKEAAHAEGTSIAALVERIDRQRGSAGLSSAVRVWLLDYYRSRADGRLGQVAAQMPGRGH
jgi:predicted DNA-binding ribbon-helix-helix protein